jgi:hypothetical protein
MINSPHEVVTGIFIVAAPGKKVPPSDQFVGCIGDIESKRTAHAEPPCQYFDAVFVR